MMKTWRCGVADWQRLWREQQQHPPPAQWGAANGTGERAENKEE